ncbi:MAG: UDP-N-acetyl-D-glucosamine dehydrogenase [Candidatus Omnitrophica bacterium CG11_big_fil_rev_8_21_14_0_20_63_9]|nr:MAG: UDP-N-acetyl-D-glucosamine dehydrogenase [Candidatus Omnitrophica bacterium CG11_big_fil_rev_8_21_14_0_20_63_9]
MARTQRSSQHASPLAQLAKRIAARNARVAVIGLGYVGLPLAVEFAKEGFRVTGIDLDRRRVDGVNRGRSYILDVPSEDLQKLRRARRLSATSSFEPLGAQDAIIICVPTPLRKTREPDMSFIVSASQEIAKRVRRGQLIVLESTTYPGTTEEVILPAIQAHGLTVGKDFCLAFSPERIDPGNATYTTRTIPKVIGGITPQCTRLATALYGTAIHRTVPVSSAKVAEMVKLLENTFRAVNIGLVNEIALICHRLGVDVWEVINAAKTKPFGFMPFYPGPGIGGHCIPSDPVYLAWKVRAQGSEARFIELATQINGAMPEYVVHRTMSLLNDRRKSMKGAKVLLLGLAYKPNVGDLRDSPALDVARLLKERGAIVQYHDPFVPSAELNGRRQMSKPLTAATLRGCDCAVVLTDHSKVDYDLVRRQAPVVLDTRNHYGQLDRRQAKKIVKL